MNVPLPPGPSDEAARLPTGSRRSEHVASLLVAIVVVVVTQIIQLRLLESRGFNPDEFQHLHAAWQVSRGLVPYRDFFEHHTPALYYVAAPFVRLLDVETEPNDAWACLVWARRSMWASTAALLALTCVLGARCRDRRTGWLATAILATTVMFLGKTLEFRPDVPASLLLVAGTLGLQLASRAGPAQSRWLAAAGGLALSAAPMFTQKAAFAVMGIAVGALWALRTADGERRVGLARWSAAGFLTGAALGAAFLAWQGALGAFLERTLLLNLRWKARLGPGGVLAELLRQNGPWLVLGLAGLVQLCHRWVRGRTHAADALICAGLIGGLGGLFLVPVVHRQYALVFLPFLALAAAGCLSSLAGRLLPRAGERSRDVVLALALFAASVHPLAQMNAAFLRSNNGDLEGIRYVLRNSAPSETVLDGFSGLGLFRPPAYDYPFLHDEIRQMLSDADRARLLSGLRSGAIAPKLVILDEHLRAVSPQVTAFIEEHYVPVDPVPIRARLYDNGLGYWNDEARRRLAGPAGPSLREPHVLIGEGWLKAESSGGRSYRRSRGPRSLLDVPVREAGRYRATISARLEIPESPVELSLRVNRRPAGSARLAPGWREYGLEVPEPLARGLNRFVLRYSTTPRQLDPNGAGADSAVSVEWIRLTRYPRAP